jgi:predicted ATPase
LAAGSSGDEKRYADELIARANEQGFPYLSAIGLFHSGSATPALGQPQEGLNILSEALAANRAIGSAYGTAWNFIERAKAHGKTDQFDIALDLLTEAESVIEATGERFIETELHRSRGDLLLATGDQGAAEKSYHRALALARQQSAKFNEIRVATNLARLWRDQGKPAEAGDLLAPVYNWFTEGFDTPVLQDAKALLDELRA